MTPDRHEQHSIKRAISGDAEAYLTLCQRHLEAVYRYFFFRLGSVIAAEGMTEALFVRAWESLAHDSTVTRLPFIVWLFRLADELVVERHQANVRAGIHPPSPPQIAWSDDAQTEVPLEIHPRDVARAIMQLDLLAQQVIVLRFVAQLPHEDTAEALDDTEDGSRVLQYRALSELREILTHIRASKHAYASDHVGAVSFCLDRVISGRWTVAQCLEHMPEETEHLKETLRFALMIREARRVVPRRVFEARFFGNLLSSLRNSGRPPQEKQWDKQLLEELTAGLSSTMLAALMIGFIAILTVGGTAGVVAAVNRSLPGDALYRLDLRLEQRYLSFLDDPAAQSQFVLRLAEERLQEAETLAHSGEGSRLQVALVAYSLHIGSIAEDVKRVNSVMESDDLDLILADQQRHLDKILAESVTNSSGTAQTQNVARIECDGQGPDDGPLHPIGVTLAAQHGIRYDQVITWVCAGHSFGEIILALASDVHEESAPDRLLDLKAELGGWGQLWKAMGSDREPSE